VADWLVDPPRKRRGLGEEPTSLNCAVRTRRICP
jgi:hypothetical protein